MEGFELPDIVTAPPGPRSAALLARLAAHEAPSLTLPGGVVWAEALGANVWDVDGNRYVDMTAAFGVAAVGHRHPEVVAAIREQSAALVHGMGDVFANEARIALVERIATLAPIDDARVFLAGGGAEAVEIALKTALLATGKPGVLAWSGGYHGLTLGALAPTSRDAFRRPFLPYLSPYVTWAPFPYSRDEDPELVARSLTEAEALIQAAATPIGALIVEPVQGREGELPAPRGWLAGLRTLCDKHEIVLIADEIFTGWGRTGRRWGVDHDGIAPDLICVGKGMTGGMPLAACVGRADLMEAWRVDGEPLHTATFMGNPVTCASALATIAIIEREQLARRSAELGAQILERLRAELATLPIVADVRGRGLMLGIELVRDGRPAPELAGAVAERMLGAGVLVLAGGMHGNVVSLTPPLVIAHAQVDFALDTLAATVRGLV